MTPVLTTLANFNGASGQFPNAGLSADAAGDLFGMTATGGAYGYGAVFELVNNRGGGYTPVTLLSFSNTPGVAGSDSGVIADAAGNLFGTIPSGGATGDGAVFELVNHGGGAYTPVTLLSFNGANGALPSAGLIADAAGNLFGTTAAGGASGDGAVFEIARAGAGYASTPTTLFSFDGASGAGPASGLIADAAGNLFGVTPSGGANGYGTVFELVRDGGGVYTPVTLLSFNGADGRFASSLITDAAGNLFGTTSSGGAYGYGTVFELVNNGGGYTPVTLLSFNGADGANPGGGLIADAAGDLFGTTGEGGAYSAPGQPRGTVFELVNNRGGSYTPVTLLSFNGADGAGPVGSLIADAAGDLFGATAGGGAAGDGTAFEITNSGFVTKGSTPPPATSSNILWRNSNGDFALWNSNGSGGFTGQDLGIVGASWQIEGTGNFNGSGEDGILWRNTSGDAYLWNSNSSGGFTGEDLGVVASSWQIEGTGDFNGSGEDGILWRNTNGDAYLWNSDSSGGFTGEDLGVVASSWQIEGTGDFNGSGRDGILWRNTNGDAYLWNSNGSGGFTGQDLGVVASSWQIEGTGDFNGSGRDGILWRNTNGDAYLWNSNGSGGFTGQDLGVVNSSWQIQGAGDFNGSGRDGILWRNTNGDVALWNANTSGGFTYDNLGVVAASWQIFKQG